MLLKNKTIVITGGTSGIGYELVRVLNEENKVIVISRPSTKLTRLKETYPDIVTYAADLSDHNQIRTVGETLQKEHNHIDLLINNAAIQYTPTLMDSNFRYETIAQEITLNLTAICALSSLLLPSLLHEEEAGIVNLNSGLGLFPKTNSAVYCATKGGVNLFSQSLRYQLEQTNIRVFQVFMPLVDTPMTEGRGTGKISPQQAVNEMLQSIEKNQFEINIGKVKLLRLLIRIMPGVARKILKNG